MGRKKITIYQYRSIQMLPTNVQSNNWLWSSVGLHYSIDCFPLGSSDPTGLQCFYRQLQKTHAPALLPIYDFALDKRSLCVFKKEQQGVWGVAVYCACPPPCYPQCPPEMVLLLLLFYFMEWFLYVLLCVWWKRQNSKTQETWQRETGWGEGRKKTLWILTPSSSSLFSRPSAQKGDIVSPSFYRDWSYISLQNGSSLLAQLFFSQ